MSTQSLAIIPAFNEEKSIAIIVQETKKYVDQVLVVDDHSTDNTGKVAKLHGATVIYHSRNKGVGAAMKTGIAYAKKLKPNIVITIDADGQHRPKDIPRLTQPIIAGEADFVLGSRFLDGQSMNMSQIKKVGNMLITFITSLLAGVKLTDTQTGFRAFNRKVLLSLDLVSDFTYTQEMILVICYRGFRCAEVPVQMCPRKYGRSKVVSKISAYALRDLMIIFSTYLRLKIHR
ncbi:MAG TPA: glycosyltransferase family 2 protein [Thermoplasmata archaeon]|nr:glycosyltransferase family 2 protein [Thermoplasmata archaeon]